MIEHLFCLLGSVFYQSFPRGFLNVPFRVNIWGNFSARPP